MARTGVQFRVDIPDFQAPEIARATVSTLAREVVERVKPRAPKRTGALRASIGEHLRSPWKSDISGLDYGSPSVTRRVRAELKRAGSPRGRAARKAREAMAAALDRQVTRGRGRER